MTRWWRKRKRRNSAALIESSGALRRARQLVRRREQEHNVAQRARRKRPRGCLSTAKRGAGGCCGKIRLSWSQVRLRHVVALVNARQLRINRCPRDREPRSPTDPYRGYTLRFEAVPAPIAITALTASRRVVAVMTRRIFSPSDLEALSLSRKSPEVREIPIDPC